MDIFICFSLKWKFIFLRRILFFQTTTFMYFFLELRVSKRGMISSEDLHFLFLHACLGEIDIVLLGIIRFNWKTAKFIMFNNFNFSSFEISIKITFTGHGSKDSRGRGRPFLISLYHFHPPQKHSLAGLLLKRGHLCTWLVMGLEPGTFAFRAQIANH